MEMVSVRYATRELYWIHANRLIRRAAWTENRSWNVTSYLRVSVGSAQNSILGLALDWIAGNLYFSYNSNAYGHLEVNRLATDHRLVLRKGKNETIYAIAVNPKRRYAGEVNHATERRSIAHLDSSTGAIVVHAFVSAVRCSTEKTSPIS